MNSVLLILVPFPDKNMARLFCKTCVQKKLVACAQILPQVDTFYLWKGEEKETSEVLVLFKTTPDLKRELVKEILSAHSYECPAIFSSSVQSLNTEYTEWVKNSVFQRQSD